MSEEMYKSMLQDAIRALSAIDKALGMPEDGCNSTERTLTAIRLLHAAHRDDVAEIERLRGLLREWFDASDPNIGGSPGSLLERTRAALGTADQPSAAASPRCKHGVFAAPGYVCIYCLQDDGYTGQPRAAETVNEVPK